MHTYRKLTTGIIAGVQNTTSVFFNIPLVPPMRASPTVTLLNGIVNLSGPTNKSSSGSTITGTVVDSRIQAVITSLNGFSSLTAGQMYYSVDAGSGGSSDIFTLDAELV